VKKGQNMLEYIILTAIVITIVVLFSGDFFTKLTGVDNQSGAFGRHFDNMRARIGVGN